MEAHLDDETKDFLKKRVAKANVYVEYGCGGSTLIAFKESRATIICVESDKRWANKVIKATLSDPKRIKIHLMQMGVMKNWGYPVSEKINGMEYACAPWLNNSYADLVLIDGRYRVACFMKTLFSCSPGAEVIFEDYYLEEERNYERSESVLVPRERIGRSAIFVIPECFDREFAESMFKDAIRDQR